MKFNYSNKKTGGYILAFFLLFGIVVTVASSTAQAQYRDRYDRYGNHRYGDRDWNRRNAFHMARQQGYSYGMNVGAADAQRGRSFNPYRSRYFRNPTLGYNSYGDRGLYRQVFRDAFVQGYRDGYQRFAYRHDRRWGRW